MLLGTGAIVVGRVLRAHGIEGAVIVEIEGHDPRTLLRAERVILEADPGTIPYRVVEARPMSVVGSRTRVWMRLFGLDTPERARSWVGADVRIEPQFLTDLEPGEHYSGELIGLVCRSTRGRELGRVVEVWPTAGVDQLLVEGAKGPFFVPARDEVLQRVDSAAGELWIDLEALGFDPTSDEA